MCIWGGLPCELPGEARDPAFGGAVRVMRWVGRGLVPAN